MTILRTWTSRVEGLRANGKEPPWLWIVSYGMGERARGVHPGTHEEASAAGKAVKEALAALGPGSDVGWQR